MEEEVDKKENFNIMQSEKEFVGTIVSTLESPSPSRIDFVINNGSIHKGMFVELNYDEGIMLCLVEDLVKTNRYFERPDSVKTMGGELEKNFPVADWEFLVARAKPLGLFNKTNQVLRPTFPPSPGTKVAIANNENIKKFLGMEEKGLMLGEIPFHNIPVSLNMSKLLQKHLAILAMSGGGKSYLLSVLLEELLERKKEQGQLAVIAFDTHGEYTSFGEPTNDSDSKDYSSKTRVIDARQFQISSSSLSVGMLSSLFPKITPVQKRCFGEIIYKLREEMKAGVGPFNLDAIKSEVMNLDEKTASPLLSYLSELSSMRLFGKIDSPNVRDLAKQGQLTVIDLNGIISERKKQLIVSHISKQLFNLRRSKNVPPFSLLVEEAHNFIPESTAGERALARQPLQLISREGRKFGASLIIVSQRPKRLDTTTLANCNTNIILRITNPYDLDHIKQSSEALDSASLNTISSLRVGEAMISGEALRAPTFFKVRLRKSAPSKHESSLEKTALYYSSDENSTSKENEVFL